MNTTVKRPNSLIEARYTLSSKQNDIIDLVLTKLRKDDNKLEYEIVLSDYIDLFSIGSTNVYTELKKAVREFGKNGSFFLYDYKGEEEQELFWFVKIIYRNKEGKIIFKLDGEVKEILLEIKNITFYNVRYPLNMTSTYSKRMYYYLKRFEDTGYRKDRVEDLRRKLNCPESYNKFTFFKRRVLDIAEKEINATDIKFTFKSIKNGNKIEWIEFYITKNIPKNKDNTLKNMVADSHVAYTEDKTIDKELINQVKSIIKKDISNKDCISILNVAKNDIEKVKEKYKLSENVNTDNLVGWIISAIKNDYKNISSNSKNKFCNYEMRDASKYELYSHLDAYITNGVLTITNEQKERFIAKNKQYIEIFDNIGLNAIK